MSNDSSASKPEHAIHVWVNPPETPLPLTRSPVRIAIGTPAGPSSNSWKIWVHRQNTYVACRDNFHELKVSLHASGIWRLGFTEKFARTHPNIVPEGQGRVWKKWKPTLDGSHRAVVAFQIVAPAPTLYLTANDRKGWSPKVVFVEPPRQKSRMTVFSVTVVMGDKPVIFEPETHGAVIAALPLGEETTVQLVATHEDIGDVVNLIEDAFDRGIRQFGGPQAMPDQGVFFVMGDRGTDIPWVSAVCFRRAPAYAAPCHGL